MTDQREFENQVAIVTGGARGIGHAISLQLAEAGAKVVIAQRSRDSGEAAVAEIADRGGEAIFIRTDITSQSDVHALISAVTASYERIDLLVNNAGGGDQMRLLDMPLETWQSVIDIDLTGSFLCSQAAARVMVARQIRGSIVNISSASAFVPSAGAIHYAVAKVGLNMLTRGLALELADHGIRVNAIASGPVATSAWSEEYWNEGPGRKVIQRVALGHVGKDKDIADAVLFLASSKASYITGHVLVVDGGYSLA